jgi:hypothetical protein
VRLANSTALRLDEATSCRQMVDRPEPQHPAWGRVTVFSRVRRHGREEIREGLADGPPSVAGQAGMPPKGARTEGPP